MNVFVGRQPILDRHLRTYAYELLFRSGGSNGFDGTDAVTATSTVIANTFLSIGVERILGERRGFINFPRDLLVSQEAESLPASRIVIEILETVQPDPDVLEACKRLKSAGFLLALDDFDSRPEMEPLTNLADFIKVDFRATPPEACEQLASDFAARGIRMLAEKVESQEEVDRARRMGYEYFQGYFFARPQIVAARDVPKNKITCLRLLRELQKPALDFDQLASLTRLDPSIAHKLLRYVNSAAFSFSRRIESIQHAMVAMGEKDLRRVLLLAILTGAASDKPHELTHTALSRGRLCESLAAHSGMGVRAGEGFLMGMFSLLDAMIGRPIQELANELGLSEEVRAALTGESVPDCPFAAIYRLCLACEAVDGRSIEQLCGKLGLAAAEVTAMHVEAMNWSDAVLRTPAIAAP